MAYRVAVIRRRLSTMLFASASLMIGFGAVAGQESDSWQITESAEVEIPPNLNAETDLYRVMDAILQPNGSLIIANAGTGHVLFVDSSGTLTAQFGGMGQGPEEFAFIRNLSIYRDSLYIFDGRLQRFTVLDPARSFVRTERFPTMNRPPRLIDRFDDGRWFMRVAVPRGRGGAGALQRTVSEIYVLDSDMAEPRLVGTFPANIMATFQAGPEVGYREAPFSPSLEISVRGTCAYALSTDHGAVWVISSEGAIVDSLQLPVADREIGTQDMERWVDQTLAQVPPQARAQMRSVLQDIPTPPNMPTYRALVVDPMGFLWVGHLDEGGPDVPRRWTIWTASGGLTGDLQLPRGEILDIQTNRLVLLVRTESGEEALRVFRFQRPRSAAGGTTDCIM